MKTELQIAADKLVNELFAVKPGETVVLTADYESNENVLRAVADSVKEAGAQVMVITILTPRSVGKAADPDLPIEPLAAALCACDVWIEFNHQWLLYSTPFERASRENKKLRYMCLVDFDEALMIRTVGHVETPQLQVFMRRVAELTRNAKTMRVTTPADTDVRLEINPQHYVCCDCGDATFPAVHRIVLRQLQQLGDLLNCIGRLSLIAHMRRLICPICYILPDVAMLYRPLQGRADHSVMLNHGITAQAI